MGQKSSKLKVNLGAEVFFTSSSRKNDMSNDSQPKTQIQLSFSLKSADSQSSYTIYPSISEEKDRNYKSLGKTEEHFADEEGNINFSMTFILDYYFEKQQFLVIKITKGSAQIDLNTTIGNIMGTRGQVLTKKIENCSESVVISGSELKNTDTGITMKLGIGVSQEMKVFFRINRCPNKVSIDRKTMVNIYKSEVCNLARTHLNTIYDFLPIVIPISVLSKGEYDYPFFIDFYNVDEGTLFYSQEATVNKFLSNDLKCIDLSLNGNSQVRIINKSHIAKSYSFIDYLKGGLQLSLSIGIDFTGSNGNPLDQISLHYIGSNSPNSYEKAIRSCGDIVAYYDYDQMFPVFGFGSVLPGMSQTSHCFPLSLQQDPNIYLIDNVLSTYRAMISKFSFSGPTYFSPLINQILMNIKASSNQMLYHILLILTDGIINDMNETIEALVEGSFLPFSVIIVGIGQTDFSNMNILDADDSPLVDKRGRKSARDLVQFVPFYQYENDGKRLASAVLEEIPRQVIEYYQMKNIPPGDPIITAELKS